MSRIRNKAKRMAGCKCIDDVQSQLKDRGVTLVRHFQIDFKTQMASLSPPVLAARKIDPKKGGRLPEIVCAYCPFCGKKYPG